jgi:hypothetical protein
MSALRPEHYLQAAKERIEQAGRLYESKADYGFVIYLVGLAVECLFRAFKARRDPVFDERHDLKALFQATGLRDLVSEAEWSQVHKDAETLWLRWNNSLRYYSEDRARSYFKKQAALRKGVTGDILKALSGAAAGFRSPARGERSRTVDLLGKARSVLRKAFPRPSRIQLEDYYGVTGVITSPKFRGMDVPERVDMLLDLLKKHLTEAERKKVGLIMTITPEEERLRQELENSVNGR